LGVALLKELEESGVVLSVVDGKLRYQALKGALTLELREYISNHKQGLLEYLTLPGQRLYSPIEGEGRLSYAIGLAEAAGYPELILSKFETVPAGARNWRSFVEHATEAQLGRAVELLH
jgi:TubC N-terminal docking domain